MATPRSYGTIPDQIPMGMSKRVNFPELMMLDQRTMDGRLFYSDGFTVDEMMMPLTIWHKNVTGNGHDGAVPAGALYYVEVHADGTVSGVGYTKADATGRLMEDGIATQTNRLNSVDLRDVVPVKMKFPDFEEMFKEDENGFLTMMPPQLDFPNSKLAGTTIVPIPAFSRARVELDQLPDTLVASFSDGWTSTFDASGEIIAAMGADTAPWDDFFVPEADVETKLMVTADGRVFGHLGSWDKPHVGMNGKKVYIPRSRSNYADFNKPGVLTERGYVETGPIYLYGGHKPGTPAAEIDRAHGSIENTWADVRLSDGRIGPWVSGRVRPGTTPEMLYAARASRISGHWINDELYAIVSVNSEGFPVTGNKGILSDEQFHLVASFDMAPLEDPELQGQALSALALMLIDD